MPVTARTTRAMRVRLPKLKRSMMKIDLSLRLSSNVRLVFSFIDYRYTRTRRSGEREIVNGRWAAKNDDLAHKLNMLSKNFCSPILSTGTYIIFQFFHLQYFDVDLHSICRCSFVVLDIGIYTYVGPRYCRHIVLYVDSTGHARLKLLTRLIFGHALLV